MIRLTRNLSLAALLIFTGVLAGAAKPTAPKYIPETSLDITTLLPPPPPAGSPEAKADLAVVLRTQRESTDAEKARAISEKKLSITAFTPELGPWFTPENLPQTAALFKHLESDSKCFTTPGKQFFERIRPFEAASDIADIVHEGETEFSYPSGHSTRATLYAAVLAQIMPDFKDKLLLRSQQIGWDRVIAGAHYPSDIIAGRVLGQALAKIALANPAFQIELEKVRAEITAASQKAAAASTFKGSHK